jgi:hypothetical protein
MILSTVSLIFFVVDPVLGVITALVLPSVMALDVDNSHSYLLAYVLFASAILFLRNLISSRME